MGMSEDAHNSGISTVLDKKPKLAKPRMYKVLFLNDDYTPMDFVVEMLQKYFHKNVEEAATIMMEVHTKGVGVAGVFTYEVAETKATEVLLESKTKGHPLQLVLEPIV